MDVTCPSMSSEFLSTPSARRATGGGLFLLPFGKFLSTPSARRATGELLHSAGRHVISIHALREEGDTSCVSCSWPRW